MQSFIFKDLKKASLNKDISKVPTLGPYAYVMQGIITEGFELKLINDIKLQKKYLR